MSLLLLLLEYCNAIWEGDGDRVLRLWKFLLIVFKGANRRNYAIEAFTALAQYYFTLPPRLAEQLKWSRFINTSGYAGRNIPCDLHIEHINRAVKTAISGLGANLTPLAIVRVGKCIGPLMKACNEFDKEVGITLESGAHSHPNFKKDLAKLLDELHNKSRVFDYQKGRKHKSFKAMKGVLCVKVNQDDLSDWMDKQFRKIA